MKTMIPNQLKFDLDLQDLPARASETTLEALSLTGGLNEYCKDYELRANGGKGARTPYTYNGNLAYRDCARACGSVAIKVRNKLLTPPGGTGYDAYWGCECCY